MFTSGFTMNSEMALELMDSATIQLIKIISKNKNCAITAV